MLGLCLSMLTGVSYAKGTSSKPPPPLDPKTLDLEFCEDTADLFGYLMTVSNYCRYEINKAWMNHYTDTNNKCIKKFGQKKIYNTTLSAVHSANADINQYEKADMCSGIYKSYKDLL